MLNDSVRVLNFDASVVKQKTLLSRYNAEVIDLSRFSSSARLWCRKKTEDLISPLINDSGKNSITFLGSGDFHHISHILLKRFSEPFCVIDFDLHPDWDILPPRLGCGSWVTRAVKNDKILKFILIGASSDDISTFAIQTGNLGSLKDGRVEIYPYSHKSSRVFLRKVPPNLSIRVKEGLLSSEIRWNELKGKDLKDFFSGILKRLPAKNIYLTIDKDCLKSRYAVTNWEEGGFDLEELLLMLRLVKENAQIIGADVTGDYSKSSIKSKFKQALSYLDHPKKIAAAGLSEDLINSVNEDTNLKIIEAIR